MSDETYEITYEILRGVVKNGRSTSVNPFEAVKEQLLEHGWTRLTQRDVHGQMCLSGAVNAAVLGLDATQQFCAVWEERHGQPVIYCPCVGCHVTVWNDLPGRTFNEVTDELDACSLVWKERFGG